MKRLAWLLCAAILAASGAGFFENASAAAAQGGWIDISAKVIKGLAAEGKKPGWPGKSAGIAVDRTTGDVFMVIADQGIWRSSDHGESFARVDGGKIGGRCETGFALNIDPKGKRLACFMLDGPSACTLDGGKTWEPMLGNGRGWDAGSVDWSAKKPVNIFALRHECGGEIYTSADLGKSWKLKGNAFAAAGIFDAATLVAAKEKEKGIFRSTDGGGSWQKVSALLPAGRDIRILDGVAYWTSSEGLLVSRDAGKTWAVQGAAVECSFGPYFGKDARHVVVAGKKGFFETSDGGASWAAAAPLPAGFGVGMPGWFINLGWDPIANIFYISRMGEPAYKYQR
ncbi:MAG: hypothetical protein ABSG68_22150 [Thermoguttaceae bacterium]|jgi:hypothetical protein